jgi:polysaccharide export outer membrane protein
MERKMVFTVLLALACLAVAAEAQRPKATFFGDGEYFLGPEDVIEVWVWKEPDLSTTVTVRPDGKLSLPLIGELEAREKTALQLEEEIRNKLNGYLAEPVVTVIVKEVNFPKISVLGKVNKPDVYKIKQKITVLDAIALAGGFTHYAKRDRVTIIRNNSSTQQRYQVNLKDPDKEGKPVYLQPFDTVYVE